MAHENGISIAATQVIDNSGVVQPSVSIKVEQVKNALALNPNTQLKEQISPLVEQIIKTFPELDANLLAQRLLTFKVKAADWQDRNVVSYRVNENVIAVQTNKLNQYDHSNVLAQGLLQMAIVKQPRNNMVAIDDVPFDVIDKGMAQMMANLAVGNNAEEEAYIQEHIVMNLMDMLTNRALSTAYIKDDVATIKSTIGLYGLNGTMQKAVNDSRTSGIVQWSQMASIQKDLLIIAADKNPFILKDLYTNIATSQAILKTPSRGLENLHVVYQSISANVNVNTENLNQQKTI